MRGNHRQLVTRAAHSKRHRCFTCWCVAPAPDVCVDQCCLIAPGNLSTLSLGLHGGVLRIEPRFDGFGALLIGLFNRLLRGKAPARQVVADRSNRQFETQLLVYVLAHSTSAQGKVHLQLLGALVTNRLADGLLLPRCQAAATAWLFTSNTGLERCRLAFAVHAQCGVDRRPAQPRLLNNLHHADPFAMHADNLFAAFVQYFSRLLAASSFCIDH
jgi:hypothetical protein